ncbi:DUF6646 family protein [Riemerella columbina]|uniref:DUF6646 family protein n=1 Tax=Riemerella columbina TaxID=103810 RepID=UPI00266FC4D9|nr:DUF6646 family protein [Riemerella columbina]WKS95499.1 hypothetical protein NYR17_01805 [Riemerella columbina]
MKKTILVMAMVLLAQLSFAQAWNGKGDQKVQIGLSAWGYGSGLSGTYDYGVSNAISIGAGAHFYFSKNQNEGFFLFGRGNYHLQDVLNLPDEWDIYPGLDLGVLGNTFGLGAHIGVRYFFTPKIGAFAEIGNNGGIGLSINL